MLSFYRNFQLSIYFYFEKLSNIKLTIFNYFLSCLKISVYNQVVTQIFILKNMEVDVGREYYCVLQNDGNHRSI